MACLAETLAELVALTRVNAHAVMRTLACPAALRVPPELGVSVPSAGRRERDSSENPAGLHLLMC